MSKVAYLLSPAANAYDDCSLFLTSNDAASTKDYVIRMRNVQQTGTGDGAGGLPAVNYCVKSGVDCYVLLPSPTGLTVQRKVNNGSGGVTATTLATLSGSQYGLPIGEWHNYRITVTAAGSHTIKRDGTTISTFTDATHTSGSAGMQINAINCEAEIESVSGSVNETFDSLTPGPVALDGTMGIFTFGWAGSGSGTAGVRAIATTYTRYFDGQLRVFNMNGDQPFGSYSGGGVIHDWLYNGLDSTPVSSSGVSPWIDKQTVDASQVTRFQVFNSDNQLYDWRSQYTVAPLEMYKRYRITIEFKLDASWVLNEANGDGLMWQMMHAHKAGQYGNSSMGLSIDQTGQLYLAVLYPTTAMDASSWPTSVTWTGSQYVTPTRVTPLMPVTKDEWHTVVIEFFADDRPPQFGGQGMVTATYDGQPWVTNFERPTVQPDRASGYGGTDPHWDFGWYNWGRQPATTRTIYMRQANVQDVTEVDIHADMSKTLGGATGSAAGQVRITANLSRVMGAQALSASASHGTSARIADLARALGALQTTAAAKATVKAALARTLGALAASGSGSSAKAIDDAQFTSWLSSSSAIRCILIEAGASSNGVEVVRYLSNTGYVTGPTDNPANTHYDPAITGDIKYSEAIPLDGGGSMAWGDIEVFNADGSKDGWLADNWSNRQLRIYIGDPRWARSDFRMVFDGVVDNIDSRSQDRLNIKLRDKLQRLNVPIIETTISSTDPDLQDQVVPLTFGEPHNVTPILVDKANLTYQFHYGTAERIVEVRDSGVPVGYVPDTQNGRFSLTAQAFGAITASVQGEATPSYINNIAAVIQRLATFYGPVATRFSESDIDLDNFSAFAVDHPDPVGLYLSDRTNMLETITALADSVGAQLVPTRGGQLRLLQLDLDHAQRTPEPREITAADMLANSLHISNRPGVSAAVKLSYARNWTVQDGLQTAIPEEHKLMYAKEWLFATARDTDVADAYKLDREPEQEDTLLVRRNDSEQEAQRRLSMRRVQRTVYGFTGYSNLLDLQLGDAVLLRHVRFNLLPGKRGMVIGLAPDWKGGIVDVEVLT